MPAVLNASTFKKHPYEVQAYLYIDTPPQVFVAQVDGNVTFPCRSFKFHNVTVGVYTDVERYQDVWYGTAPGLDDLGRGYTRLNPGSNIFFIPRSSQGVNIGECNVVNGSYVTVVDQFSMHCRAPWIADGIELDDSGSAPPLGSTFKDTNIDPSAGVTGYPWINFGGGPIWVNNVDSTTNLITVTLSPNAISKVYNASAITTWLWNIKDGTLISGSLSGPNITVTFPVGRRVIKVTGTDNHGHSTTRHLLIVGCKKGTAYEPITSFIAKLSDLAYGHQLEATIYSSVSTQPDGMYMALWTDEWYNGTHGPQNVCSDVIGQTGFEHIWFSGWHWNNGFKTVADANATLSEVTLIGLDCLAMLDVLPGFVQEVNRVATPVTWVQLANAAMWLYEWYLFFWHSTAAFCGMDFYDDGVGDSFGFQRLGSGETTLAKQLGELTDRAIGYECRSNQQNMVLIRPNPQLQVSGARTSTVILSTDEGDSSALDVVVTWFPTSYWDHGSAIIAQQQDVGTAPILDVFAVAPGLAPGVGPQKSDLNEQLTIDQASFLTRTGLRRANTGTNIFKPFNWVMVHNGNAGIERAYQQWVDITYTTIDVPTQRPIVFSSARFRPLSQMINIVADVNGVVVNRSYIIERETIGIDAVFDPQPANPNPPPILPPTASPVTIPTQSGLQTGGTVWMWDDSRHFAFTYNFSSGSNWTSCVGTGLTGQIWEVKFDPYSPWWANPSRASAMYAWVTTTNGLFYGNCNSSSPIWSQKRSVSVPYGLPNQIRAASSLPGEVCWRYLTGGNTYVEWLNNYGSNIVWSGGPWYTYEWGLDIDQYGSRTAYLNASLSTVNIYRVVNGGTPQFMRAIPDPGNGTWLFIQKPLLTFGGAPNNQVGAGTTECLLVCSSSVPGAPQGMDITADGGNTWNTIDGSPHKYVDVLATSAIATDNSNIIAAHDGSYQIQTTINKGGLWTPKGTPPFYDSHGIIKFPGASTYAICGCNMQNAFLSTDFGATTTNFFGDWASSQGSGSLFGILPASNTSHG